MFSDVLIPFELLEEALVGDISSDQFVQKVYEIHTKLQGITLDEGKPSTSVNGVDPKKLKERIAAVFPNSRQPTDKDLRQFIKTVGNDPEVVDALMVIADGAQREGTRISNVVAFMAKIHQNHNKDKLLAMAGAVRTKHGKPKPKPVDQSPPPVRDEPKGVLDQYLSQLGVVDGGGKPTQKKAASGNLDYIRSLLGEDDGDDEVD